MSEQIYEYIGGAAGCGKTWLARERAKADPFGTRLTASTGIAAINLGSRDITCTTINSLLWYFNTRSLEDAWTQGRLDLALRRLYEDGVKEIIVDEVSMMSGAQLDIICKALDYLNETHGFNEPMGLTLIGDFCQLPPVDERREGFVFQAKHWDRFEPAITILTEIKRQTDVEFIEALRHVRRGDGGSALDFFAPQIERRLDIDFEGTTIMAKNIEVDRFNDLRLNRLEKDWVRFPSFRHGKQLKEWERNIPQIFEAKLEALVMILVNKTYKNSGGLFKYVNGDLGYIREITDRSAWVELIRTGETVEVEYAVKENAEKNKKSQQESVVGSCEHMPLRVAYATTCHKSQGLTLDRVQINLNGQFFSYGGMAYVGLSRARTAEGLRIIVGNDNTFIKRCKTNPKVKRWL